MKKIKLIKVLSFIFFLQIIFSGCSLYKPVEVGNIEGIKIKEFSGETLQFIILLPVKNPNSYSIKLVDCDFDISLNNFRLGKVICSEKPVIPANSNEVQEFPVEVKLEGLFSGMAALYMIFTKKEVKIKVKGDMKVKALFLSKKIEIEEESTVKLFK